MLPVALRPGHDGHDVEVRHEHGGLERRVRACPRVQQAPARHDLAGQRGVHTRERLRQEGMQAFELRTVEFRWVLVRDCLERHRLGQPRGRRVDIELDLGRGRYVDLFRREGRRVVDHHACEYEQRSESAKEEFLRHERLDRFFLV